MIVLSGRKPKAPRVDKYPGFYVYTITCTSNNRVYVGESGKAYNRLCGHKAKLRGGSHLIKDMVADWARYGEKAFVFRLESQYPSKREAVNAEAKMITELAPTNELYNLKLTQPFSALPLQPCEISGLLTLEDLLNRLDTMAASQGSYYKLARQWGFTRQELSAVRNRKRPPSRRLLLEMGLVEVVGYQTAS